MERPPQTPPEMRAVLAAGLNPNCPDFGSYITAARATPSRKSPYKRGQRAFVTKELGGGVFISRWLFCVAVSPSGAASRYDWRNTRRRGTSNHATGGLHVEPPLPEMARVSRPDDEAHLPPMSGGVDHLVQRLAQPDERLGLHLLGKISGFEPSHQRALGPSAARRRSPDNSASGRWPSPRMECTGGRWIKVFKVRVVFMRTIAWRRR